MNSLRVGMQVHAVPESERAFDAGGRRLPWAYEYADADPSRHRELEEKGPFGRSVRRRGFSRSKTATPARKEDAVRLENQHVEDAIFGQYKATQRTREPNAATKGALNPIDPNAASNRPATPSEPTEVLLYGYGRDQEWAALEFFEKVSQGVILEDYDRRPPHQRYDMSLVLNRSQSKVALSQAALSKKNRYVGGDHFIKVTFDSQSAADLACHGSPHNLNGYMVYAEPFRTGSIPKDVAISASSVTDVQRNTQLLPRSNTSMNLNDRPDHSNDDMYEKRPQSHGIQRSTTVPNLSSALSHPSDPFSNDSSIPTSSLAQQPQHEIRQRPMRIRGATRAVLLPADQAFLPAPQTLSASIASWPIISSLLGSSTHTINATQNTTSNVVYSATTQSVSQAVTSTSQVPRLQDGSFDWARASLYWKLCAWLDGIFGTDLCGLRVED